MIGYIVAFMAGSLIGMLGMAGVACSARTKVHRENHVLGCRVQFLENEIARRHVQTVKDPRPKVHSLVN